MSVPGTHVRHARPAGPPKDTVATVDSLMLAERTRWAMRIHENLTQSVTSAVLELQTLRNRIATDPQGAISSLAGVEAAIRKDLGEIRAVLLELDEGERPQEPPLVRFVGDVVERWKLSARVDVEGDVDRLPTTVRKVAQGIIAEALANAARHSGSLEVGVGIRVETGELRIEVEDAGKGIVTGAGGAGRRADSNGDPHFGLRLMRTFADEVHGTLEVESTRGSGTRVVACLPFEGVTD